MSSENKFLNVDRVFSSREWSRALVLQVMELGETIAWDKDGLVFNLTKICTVFRSKVTAVKPGDSSTSSDLIIYKRAHSVISVLFLM